MRGRLFCLRDCDGRRSHHLHVVPANTFDARNERLQGAICAPIRAIWLDTVH